MRMTVARTVTIHDVAREAAVSTSTVSNVLNGRFDQMRPETTDRVRQVIARLGYAPSTAARQLKTGHAPVLGLIVPSVANPFWGAFAQSVEETALTHGYQVLLCNAERDTAREQRYAAALWSHGARGLILGSSPLSFNHLADFAARGMQIVAFDRQPRGAGGVIVDSVSVDSIAGMHLAVHHLITLGHRRIGFLSGPLRTVNRLDRLEGYRAALTEAGIAYDPALVWEGTATRGFGDMEGTELGRMGATDLLALAEPPTALVAINDMYALGAYAGARDAGRRVPDDVSIVGFDDIALAEIVTPPLTTVRHPLKELLRTAVGLLIGRIEGTRTGPPAHIVVPTELVVRGSTGTRIEKRDSHAQ